MNEQLLQDALLFYELSLTVGSSLDINENCDGFLKVLMSRRNLDFCSVWIRNKHIPGAKDDGTFMVAYANPIVKQKTIEIDEDFCALKHLKEKQMYSIGSSDKEWRDHIIEENVEGGRFFYYRLEDLGFLKLYSSTDDDLVNEIVLSNLHNIIKKFTVSMKACLLQQFSLGNSELMHAVARIAS